MDSRHHSFSSLFSVLIPVFSLLSLSWAASATTIPLLPPPSSALLAADTLRSRGYSIFASLIVSITSTTNLTGTLLAPPDFAFSLASAKFLNHHRPPPRPSIPLLLYHTLRPPLILTWPALSTRDDGDELRTFHSNNCLYLLRNSYGGEVSISSSPFKNPIAAVKIRQPDLYVDEHLTVHGIDGVLDPSFASKCSVPYIVPSADAVPLQVNRVFLDRAMRGLRRKGYNVVAAAMGVRKSDLLSLAAVTVFAVSDENLFMKPGGFRYDFRHHVLPMRQRFADFEKTAVGGMEFYTLAPNKTVAVESVDGAVTVDGVAMSLTEVYHNRWVVVVSIMSSLDDVADSKRNSSINGASSGKSVPSQSPSPYSGFPMKDKSSSVPSPAPAHIEESPAKSPTTCRISDEKVPSPSPISGVFRKAKLRRVRSPAPSPAPAHVEETENGNPSSAPGISPAGSTDFESDGTPSPAPEIDIGDNAPSTGSPSSSPSPSPEIEAAENPVSSPTSSLAADEISDIRCLLNAVVSGRVEGGDLLCPVKTVRKLRETRSDVDESKPLDASSQDADDLTQSEKVKLAESVNIADDVFFYI